MKTNRFISILVGSTFLISAAAFAGPSSRKNVYVKKALPADAPTKESGSEEESEVETKETSEPDYATSTSDRDDVFNDQEGSTARVNPKSRMSVGAGWSQVPNTTNSNDRGGGVAIDFQAKSGTNFGRVAINGNLQPKDARDFFHAEAQGRMTGTAKRWGNGRTQMTTLDLGASADGNISPVSSDSDPGVRGSGDAKALAALVVHGKVKLKDSNRAFLFGVGPEAFAQAGVTNQLSAKADDPAKAILGGGFGAIGYTSIPIGPTTLQALCEFNQGFNAGAAANVAEGEILRKMSLFCNAGLVPFEGSPVELGYNMNLNHYTLVDSKVVDEAGKASITTRDADLWRHSITVRMPLDLGDALNAATK